MPLKPQESKPLIQTEYSKVSKNDRFFTDPLVAGMLVQGLCEYLLNEGIPFTDANTRFLEPSAGDGAFTRWLPHNTIKMDIHPLIPDITQQDFLQYQPPPNLKLIGCGNPPFGMRGNKALSFIQRLAFLDVEVFGFILPMIFASEEHLPAINRMKYMLCHSEKLSTNIFYLPDGNTHKIECVWQIYRRQSANLILPPTNNLKYDGWVSIEEVNIKENTNTALLDSADVLIQNVFAARKTLPEIMAIKENGVFTNIPNSKYLFAITIHKDKPAVLDAIQNFDIQTITRYRTTGFKCTNITLLGAALIAAGFGEITQPSLI